MIFIYYFIDCVRCVAVIGYVWGSSYSGLFYILFQFNELFGIVTIAILWVLRSNYYGKFCSGEIAEFAFDGTLPLRGEFISKM